MHERERMVVLREEKEVPCKDVTGEQERYGLLVAMLDGSVARTRPGPQHA